MPETTTKKRRSGWLAYYRKSSSGKPWIPYNDAVEEALCYGWIDSSLKDIDDERFAQRFFSRRPSSALSEMNRERIKRLIKEKKMTATGLAAVSKFFGEDKERRFCHRSGHTWAAAGRQADRSCREG